MSEKWIRTALWLKDEPMCSTGVQFRTDVSPMVWMSTNIGWVPVGNAPEDEAEALKCAEKLAESYELTKMDDETAFHFLGLDEDDDHRLEAV